MVDLVAVLERQLGDAAVVDVHAVGAAEVLEHGEVRPREQSARDGG